ncbi:MAG TPA: family 10 glycosylhydrolase, partial [Bacteroidota bacterium]|nr:family 10 glycosylhydrolase [Bacteroidota bacterium]
MTQKYGSLLLLFIVVVLASGCALLRPPSEEKKVPEIPPAEREFRGVWVASVANIDWPSKPGLSTEEQQSEAITILDSVVTLRLNAVVLQVRPQCDALYDSKYEPWSYYLTGKQGKAPDPYYDPLRFWVDEAHKRGIELHAWFNPYRAHHPQGGDVTETSIVKTHPGLSKDVGGGTWWLNPTNRAVQDESFNVIMDVVRRYDIDGVHLDDYFYPYGDGNFPDDDTWADYTNSGGSLSRENWRRDAVSNFIERLYDGIKHEKPYVKFGISPFGIGRPGHPRSIGGFDQYTILYADAERWLRNGWVDYWSPQLYWPINQIPQSFPVLLGWWVKENVHGRNLWPGMIISGKTDEKGADEILNEIMIERGFVNDAPGHIHFSMKLFLKDSSALNAALKSGPYQKQALV